MATYTISGVIDFTDFVPYGSGDAINVSGTGSGNLYIQYPTSSGGGGGGGIQPQTFGQLYPWGNRY
jgi:hypothetical protein